MTTPTDKLVARMEQQIAHGEANAASKGGLWAAMVDIPDLRELVRRAAALSTAEDEIAKLKHDFDRRAAAANEYAKQPQHLSPPRMRLRG